MQKERATTPRNLVEMLLRRLAHPSKVSCHVKAGGSWRDVTWGEVLERVRALSEGLIELGVAPGDRVCVYASTSFEWCLADMAALAAGAVSVPIYSSNTAQETAYIVNDSGAKVIFVDNDKPEGRVPGRWSRVRSARADMPGVEHVVAFEMHSNPEEKLTSLWDLEARGKAALEKRPKALEERAAKIAPEDTSCILYTSGTMGRPKGVMLTHASWVSQSYSVMEHQVCIPGEKMLLFLPLAHSFARVVESTWMGQDLTVAFAESVEKVLDNAMEVRPTLMPAVPRVFEKAYNKVVTEGRAAEGVQGIAFNWAMGLFDDYASARAENRPFRSPRWALAKQLVFAKIRAKLQARFGGRVRCFISGGAPLSSKIAYFFELCEMPICEGFGMTETCAPTHSNTQVRNRIGTVGPPFPNVEVKVAEDGELLIKGPMIMKGYYKMPEETAEALTADGFLRTGDIGSVDPDGYMRITDRKKDLIKTSGGKYIAPAELENALKSEPLISQVSIQGDKRKFISALFTLSEEHVKKWASENGLSAKSFAELTRSPELAARVQKAVDVINAKQPSYATIKRFVILDHDWSQETGEMTPTMKVKRRVVAEKYKAQLDELYGEDRY